MQKIVIVDDHPVVRLAVRMLLEREGYEVAGEADNGVEALSLARQENIGLVILDIGIPKLDGLEVILRLKQLTMPPRVLVLSAQNPNHLAGRCMQAGACGYIRKDDDLNELVSAVKAVMAGYIYFPMTDATRRVDSVSTELQLIESLSDRELTVLQRLAVGRSNKDIADELLLSNKTVSTYKARLLDKLNSSSLVDLIDFAKRHSLI